MPESTRSSLFPDINVWIALSYEGHAHHAAAVKWFTTLDQDSNLIFCRFTQFGLLRLLTAEAVMGDEVLTQPEAWAAYDRWQQDDRVELMNEPAGLEPRFRTLTRRPTPATKDWADSYLAAFAASGELTLVTFDRASRCAGAADGCMSSSRSMAARSQQSTIVSSVSCGCERDTFGVLSIRTRPS